MSTTFQPGAVMSRVRGAGAFVLQSYCHGPVEIVLLLALLLHGA
jgi:hypothetical protein